MTLLVVNAEPDQAAIMTDSAWYGPNGRILVTSLKPKATALPAINAAVASRGNIRPSLRWEAAALRLADKVADFDEFTSYAPELLRSLAKRGGMRANGVHAYMVGYSPAAGRYKAYVADNAEDFALEDISDAMHVTPAPPGIQPTAVEARQQERRGDPLPDGQPVEAPTSVEGWAALAKKIHAGRACELDRTIFMHGDVTLTHLQDGQVTQETIHTFTGADLRAMVVGTFHPFGQIGACSCGSGRRFIDCCIPKWEHLDCLCGTGRPMGECCKLGADGHEDLLRAIQSVLDPDGKAGLAHPGADVTALKAGRNESCPCGSGSKFKKCCALVSA